MQVNRELGYDELNIKDQTGLLCCIEAREGCLYLGDVEEPIFRFSRDDIARFLPHLKNFVNEGTL